MDHRITKPMQRKSSAGGSNAPQNGESDDIFALLRDTQSPYGATQASSIQALQPKLGNQAIMRLMASQSRVGAAILSRSASTTTPRIGRVQRMTTEAVREDEEMETETDDVTSDVASPVSDTGAEDEESETTSVMTIEGNIPNPELNLDDLSDTSEANETETDTQTEGEVGIETGTQSQATETATETTNAETDTTTETETSEAEATETNEASLPSNYQLMGKGLKKKSKKPTALERLKQLKSGKVGPEILKAAKEATSTISEFVQELASTQIDEIVGTALGLITKALLDSEFVNQAIQFVVTTLQPLMNTLSHLIEPLIDAMDMVSDLLPIVGGVIQLVKGLIGTIGGVIKTILSAMTAKTLYEAKKSESLVVQDVGAYGFRKVLRSVLQKVYETSRSVGLVLRSVTNIALDIAAAATIGMSEAGKAVTLGLGMADTLIHLGERSSRGVKGIVKAIKGTRGLARKENATRLVEAALDGDASAQQLIIDLGVYKLTGQLARTIQEGKLVAMDNAKQAVKDQAAETLEGKFGLKKTQAEDIAIAFQEWGQDKLDKFYVWLKSKYAMFKQKGLIATVIDLLKSLFIQNKDESKQMLQADIETYHKTKNHPWKKALIMQLSLKFKSA
jgi:hypothetical protein